MERGLVKVYVETVFIDEIVHYVVQTIPGRLMDERKFILNRNVHDGFEIVHDRELLENLNFLVFP